MRATQSDTYRGCLHDDTKGDIKHQTAMSLQSVKCVVVFEVENILQTIF